MNNKNIDWRRIQYPTLCTIKSEALLGLLQVYDSKNSPQKFSTIVTGIRELEDKPKKVYFIKVCWVEKEGKEKLFIITRNSVGSYEIYYIHFPKFRSLSLKAVKAILFSLLHLIRMLTTSFNVKATIDLGILRIAYLSKFVWNNVWSQ